MDEEQGNRDKGADMERHGKAHLIKRTETARDMCWTALMLSQ